MRPSKVGMAKNGVVARYKLGDKASFGLRVKNSEFEQ